MFDKLEEVRQRYDELNSQLADPEIASNPKQYRVLAKEHAQLRAVVAAYRRYQETEAEISESQSFLRDEDPQIREIARDEIRILEEARLALREELQALLLPKDILDDKNIYLEIRAGTGGEEAALFAANLLRMYVRFSERRRWKVDVVSSNETDKGGYREVIASVAGEGVYANLKYEAGTHRVQRVPDTESQGRIHTSAVTVAILPEAEEVEVNIQDHELRIDTFRASGAGGQHVNRTDSAIRITHLPTGLVVSCQDEKSQHKNKAKALKVLRSRLFEQERMASDAERAAERKGQVGSGDRSERIRTYNFPQNRLTDHRIQLTLYKLDSVMEGALDEVIEPIRSHYQAEALKAYQEE
jgi:peptide chain release factor 1